jgi:hypothetical protein
MEIKTEKAPGHGTTYRENDDMKIRYTVTLDRGELREALTEYVQEHSSLRPPDVEAGELKIQAFADGSASVEWTHEDGG